MSATRRVLFNSLLFFSLVASEGLVHASESVASEDLSRCWVADSELRASYRGQCVDGKAQGQGEARGADGAFYRGGFDQGRKSGQGTKIFANGDAYSGQWREDRREGEGRYEFGITSPWRGDAYQGGWKADMRHGKGSYIFWPAGDRFEADWVENTTDTPGTATVTRRKQAMEVLGPRLGKIGAEVCSVTTEGASPARVARGVVQNVVDDRLLVLLENPAVLKFSTYPELNPRWEVLTDWMLCTKP